jgi:hypothetical protein
MDIAAGPPGFQGQFRGQTDGFGGFRIVLGSDRHAGRFGELIEDRFGENPVLGAINDDLRAGLGTA